MPRLVGNHSNTSSSLTLLIIFVAIASVLLEYLGVIDVMPGFGRKGRNIWLQNQSINQPNPGKTNR